MLTSTARFIGSSLSHLSVRGEAKGHEKCVGLGQHPDETHWPAAAVRDLHR